MDDKIIDVLTAEGQTTRIEIDGRKYAIGKLNAVTYFRLVRFIGKIIAKYAGQMKAMNPGTPDAESVLEFLNILDENDLVGLFAILLHTDDLEFCGKISGEDAISIVRAVINHNEIGLFLKNVQGVVRDIKVQMAKMNS